MGLLNVRLNAEDERRAKALRDAGIPISTLVREAIREEYERRVAVPHRKMRPSAVMAQILEDLPDPADRARRAVDASDRRAVRRHIATRLSTKQTRP